MTINDKKEITVDQYDWGVPIIFTGSVSEAGFHEGDKITFAFDNEGLEDKTFVLGSSSEEGVTPVPISDNAFSLNMVFTKAESESIFSQNVPIPYTIAYSIKHERPNTFLNSLVDARIVVKKTVKAKKKYNYLLDLERRVAELTAKVADMEEDIADTYEVCDSRGATMPEHQDSEHLAATVASIPRAGEIAVRFFDFDGTVLHSYFANEILNLTALPATPIHAGLTAQGWNWTLGEIKASVTDGDTVDVGCYFAPNDGKTHIGLKLTKDMVDDGEIEVKILVIQNDADTVYANWGDGTGNVTSDDYVGSGNDRKCYRFAHTYDCSNINFPVTYDVTVFPVSAEGSYGFGAPLYPHLGLFGEDNVIRNAVTHIYAAENCSIDDGAFKNGYSVKAITVPNGSLDYFQFQVFRECRALKCVTVGWSDFGIFVTGSSHHSFSECYSLLAICTTKSDNAITSMVSDYAENAYNLSRINNLSKVQLIKDYGFENNDLVEINLSSCLYIENNAFANNRNLETVTGLSNCTGIEGSAFDSCHNLKAISFPKVEEIGDKAFAYCYRLKTITIPPTCKAISGSSGNGAFIGCREVKSLTLKCKSETGSACTISQNAFMFNANANSYNDSALEWVDLTAYESGDEIPTLSVGLSSIIPLTNRYGQTVIFYVKSGMKTVFESETNWTEAFYVEGTPPTE